MPGTNPIFENERVPNLGIWNDRVLELFESLSHPFKMITKAKLALFQNNILSLTGVMCKYCDPDWRIWCHRQDTLADKSFHTRLTRLLHHWGRKHAEYVNQGNITGFERIRIFYNRNNQIVNLVLGSLLELRLTFPSFNLYTFCLY